MKINLTEGFVRALARNILFENNENIEMHEMLQEMNMSPDKTAGYGNPVHQGGNQRADIYNQKGPMTKSRKERTKFTQYEEEPELKDDLVKLPIGNNIVNFEIENDMNLEDKNVKSVKRKKR